MLEAAGRAEKLLADLRRHRVELEGARGVAEPVRAEGVRRLDEVIAAVGKVLERVRGSGGEQTGRSGR